MRKLLLAFMLFWGIVLVSHAQTKEAEVVNPKTEAKALSKNGYKILPDALHKMARQLEIVNDKQVAKDEVDGTKKYIVTLGLATSSTLNQAKADARVDAVQKIVSILMATMQSIIENNGGITEKGTTLEKIMTVVAEKCQQKMVSGPILADFYKTQNGKYTVKRYCTYGYKDAQNLAISYFESELKNESQELKAALRNSQNWK